MRVSFGRSVYHLQYGYYLRKTNTVDKKEATKKSGRVLIYYKQIDVETWQYEHLEVLIAMQKHVEEKSVLIGVQVECEHLKKLCVIDAEPGQRLRVGQVRGRVCCVHI